MTQKANYLILLILSAAIVLVFTTFFAYQPAELPRSIDEPGTARPLLADHSRAAVVPAVVQDFSTPTPVAGGTVLTLSPAAPDVGWWVSNDPQAGHLGDSFLYAGSSDGHDFVSIVRFDLRRIPRGASVHAAILRMTGLDSSRLAPAAPGAWTVQVLDPGTRLDLARLDYATLINAPTAIKITPDLSAADLGSEGANSWNLDARARTWLAEQILNGVPSVSLRISGPAGATGSQAAGSLFAWDSGAGPASRGFPPQLILSLGQAPATVPPTSTPAPGESAAFVVATATPDNVLTAVVQAWTAAATTPQFDSADAMVVVTATPLPPALATARAAGYVGDLPLVIADTPTPANSATAAANAKFATAVAVTTGTFTPVPANAVTPVLVMPTPMPKNVMTAAAHALAATAQVQQIGTPTLLPYGAIIATPTAEPPVITFTPRPANNATAIARAQYATAVAFTTGTFTPIPPGAVTPTRTPPATPVPLIEYRVTPLPTPRPAVALPANLPAEMRGKILFRTNRDGPERIYLYDPANGRVAWITQDWPFTLAQLAEGRAANGKRTVITRAIATTSNITGPDGAQTQVTADVPQLIVADLEYKTEQQITHGAALSYDAAWSPTADRIAYVSTVSGNDEIYTVDSQGENLARLTNNTWEWDKHPSWSPDGSQIVFWSNRESGRRQLWIMNADGSNQRVLLASPYEDWDPIWVK